MESLLLDKPCEGPLSHKDSCPCLQSRRLLRRLLCSLSTKVRDHKIQPDPPQQPAFSQFQPKAIPAFQTHCSPMSAVFLMTAKTKTPLRHKIYTCVIKRYTYVIKDTLEKQWSLAYELIAFT